MRNFIFFIRRFFNLILFLTLEVICVVMIERTNTLQGNDIVSSANAVSGLVYKKQNDVVYYFGLRRMNDSLQNENARLRQIIEQYRSLDTLSDSLVKTKTQVGDTSKHIVRFAEYVYRTARVINNSVNATDNFITINRGSRHGIGKNMAVLSGSGVVGRVEHVSANYSSILSVLSAKQRVSARLKNTANGFVVWEGKNPRVLTMIDVPQQVEVKKGDSVFTNSYSLYFPPEVLIGTVIKTEPIKKNAMQHIYLKSSTDFANLQYVYVVENKMRQEKTQLEDSTTKK
ncbi:MAG: rod shape-determining protein MreC [Flavipsychrobacter sp.]|nr:rod shape-determining protein MreC [Flavipsychrobacter sp.]